LSRLPSYRAAAGLSVARAGQEVPSTARPLAAVSAATIMIAVLAEVASAPMPAMAPLFLA
jgi:hypothetical protein